jgi:hypothetical protein
MSFSDSEESEESDSAAPFQRQRAANNDGDGDENFEHVFDDAVRDKYDEGQSEYSSKKEPSSMLHKTTPVPFSRGYKGSVTTTHAFPRKKKLTGIEQLKFEFANCFHQGDLEAAADAISSFEAINASKDDVQKTMADGVLTQWIQLGARYRLMKGVFNIGSARFYRLARNQEKKKGGGTNGQEVTQEMIKSLGLFIDTLKSEDGFACSHRRMKLYIDDDELTTWPKFFVGYKRFMSQKSLAAGVEFRVMKYSTLFKYMHGMYHHTKINCPYLP